MGASMIIFIGIVVVFVGLAIIVAAIKIMSGIINAVGEKTGSTEHMVAASPVPEAALSLGDIPRGELTAIVSAVIASCMGEDVAGLRIISIKKC